jgi:MoaA/NifB/PqqE/SkfB family radical SAM enzyme
MRCSLTCEFCYVGDLLNIEGEWRREMPIEMLTRVPDQEGLQVSLTGGEIFMRKDILDVMDVFQQKGYVCGYLTTNGTIITPERADALAELAAKGFLKHISVSIDGPGEMHDKARGVKGTFERTAKGLRNLQEAARKRHAPLRVSINTTVAHETLDALDQMVDVAAVTGSMPSAEPPDIQHAGGSGRDDSTDRRVGRKAISTFVRRSAWTGASRR